MKAEFHLDIVLLTVHLSPYIKKRKILVSIEADMKKQGGTRGTPPEPLELQ